MNGVILSALSGVVIGTVLEERLSDLPLEEGLSLGLALTAAAAVVTVWQFVGIWRSATNTSIRTGRTFWPRLAKAATVLGSLVATSTVITTSSDLVKVLVALQDPTFSDYHIERIGESDLIFTGAISDKSASEVISALGHSSIEILRVDSTGGLIPPAIRLARYIHENEVMVMAEGQCISACVMLLAASPYAAIYPGTQVTFHRFEPVAELTNPEFRAQNAQYLAEAEGVFKEFGVADWAIETAGRQQFWTPTVEQQIRMGLIAYIYDPDRKLFLPAYEYCDQHLPECAG